MSPEQMREEIAKAYNGQKWKDKVAQMPYNQIIAIYYSLKKREKEKDIIVLPRHLGRQLAYEQISMFDKNFKK